MKKWLFFALSCLSCALSFGQSGLYYMKKQYEEDPFDEYTYSFVGFNYLSNNVYLGRKDSIALPYYTPYVGYQLHNGLYGKASASYSPTRKNGRFDLFTLELGYDRSFGKHILTGISVEKYIYYKNSPGIRASTKDNITLYCQYQNDFIQPQVIFALNQNRSNDFVYGLSIDHNFRFLNNKLNVFPTVTYYMGSQNYFNDYFLAKLEKKDKVIVRKQIVDGAEQYKPLAVEFSGKAVYHAKSWLFTLTPTYVTPLSAAKIYLPGKVLTEKLKASLFVSLDICYRHERK